MRPVSALSILACAATIGGIATVQAHADAAACRVLQDQYVALLRQTGGAGNVDQLNRQLSEAQGAAQSGNCNRFFFFFGPPPSPACPAIMATIGRLRGQLAGTRGQGFGLFASSPDSDRASLRDAMIQNGCGIPAATGGGRTLCVRVCDGYYFPISNTASRSRYNIDAAVCQSMFAKEGRAELYVQPSGSDVDQAVSLSGKRYADQPYAFEYRQSYNESCHSELRTGIAALAVRYRNAPAMTKGGKVSLPMSALDAKSTGGIEDLSPAQGSAAEAVAAPASAGADQPATQPDPNRPVRFVGDAYDELFDLGRPAKPVPEHKRWLLPTVDTPKAAESTASYPPY